MAAEKGEGEREGRVGEGEGVGRGLSCKETGSVQKVAIPQTSSR